MTLAPEEMRNKRPVNRERVDAYKEEIMSDYETEPYTPSTNWVRIMVGYASETAKDRTLPELEARQEGYDWFDRWFLQEIERAEYSGYLRAVREGLHR